jgi:hypothetical protein
MCSDQIIFISSLEVESCEEINNPTILIRADTRRDNEKYSVRSAQCQHF